MPSSLAAHPHAQEGDSTHGLIQMSCHGSLGTWARSSDGAAPQAANSSEGFGRIFGWTKYQLPCPMSQQGIRRGNVSAMRAKVPFWVAEKSNCLVGSFPAPGRAPRHPASGNLRSHS